MMDIITGRAPPPARAESHLSKGSQELARPGPSLLEALGLRRHRCYNFIEVLRFLIFILDRQLLPLE